MNTMNLDPIKISNSFCESSIICAIATPNLDSDMDKGKRFYIEGVKKNDTSGNVEKIGGHQMAISVDSEMLTEILQHIPKRNKAFAGFYSKSIWLGTIRRPLVINKGNIIDTIVGMGTVLDERSKPRDGKRWAFLPPEFIQMIEKIDLKDPSISIDRNGRIGVIDDITIYRSNMLPVTMVKDRPIKHLLFGCSRTIAFDSQIKDDVFRYGMEIKDAEGIGVCCAVRSKRD